MNPGSGRRSLLPLPPGAPAVARTLPLSPARRRLPRPSLPAPDQFAAAGPGSEAAGEWRGESKCAAVCGRGAAEAGLRAGRDLSATGENEWGSGCRGAGGEEPGAGVCAEVFCASLGGGGGEERGRREGGLLLGGRGGLGGLRVAWVRGWGGASPSLSTGGTVCGGYAQTPASRCSSAGLQLCASRVSECFWVCGRLCVGA